MSFLYLIFISLMLVHFPLNGDAVNLGGVRGEEMVEDAKGCRYIIAFFSL